VLWEKGLVPRSGSREIVVVGEGFDDNEVSFISYTPGSWLM
jgi:hypothetical protein